MKNIILKKVNGTFLISDITPELVEEIKNSSDKHLCWLDCKNASPLTCPKVEDIKTNKEWNTKVIFENKY